MGDGASPAAATADRPVGARLAKRVSPEVHRHKARVLIIVFVIVLKIAGDKFFLPNEGDAFVDISPGIDGISLFEGGTAGAEDDAVRFAFKTAFINLVFQPKNILDFQLGEGAAMSAVLRKRK